MSALHAAAKADRSHDNPFADELTAGLRAKPKTLPCKYFYDVIGSRLFEKICELPEYYLTRTETALLRRHAMEMADLIGSDVELVEFGAGALDKVNILLDSLVRPRGYVPVDISADYLSTMVARLRKRHPGLAVEPVVADFTRLAMQPSPRRRRAGFFPGSTIGNLVRADALAFLRRAARMLADCGLLLGVDLVKDPATLHAAYNDAAGVTAAFNKNILARANRELGADFDPDGFAHYAFYDPRSQSVEMTLVSRKKQRVRLGDELFGFAEGEAVHTESSHKYTVEGFQALATEAGFRPRAVWTDPQRLFSIHWLEA